MRPTLPMTQVAPAKKSGRTQVRAGAPVWMEFVLVDAVVDLVQPFIRDMYGVLQPAGQIAAHGDVLVHHPTRGTAHQVVFPVAAVDVVHVAAMFAVHTTLDAPGSADELGFQRVQVASVQDVRPQLPEQLVQPGHPTVVMSLALAQIEELDLLRGNAVTEIRIAALADHHMAKALRRQMIEQIHHAVFHAAGTKMVDDMGDKRALIGHGAVLPESSV
jgi:hypothetical protein